MTVDQMREGLIAAYSGDRWKRKVWSMRDEQVIAVYKSFRSRCVERKDGRKKMEPGIKKAKQLSMWDNDLKLTVDVNVTVDGEIDITEDVAG